MRVYNGAYRCKLYPSEQAFVTRSEQTLLNHLRAAHQWNKSRGFADRPAASCLALSTAAEFPVHCQTFHAENAYRRYFPVRSSTHEVSLPQLTDAPDDTPLSLREQVEQALTKKLRVPKPNVAPRHKTEVSPWLDLTQWERCLQGHKLNHVACLLQLPSPGSLFDPDQPDSQLLLLLESFDRVIERARESLRTDRVNVFDQQCASSFLARRPTNFSFVHKLQVSTYTTYKKVWKKLLTFVYRRVWQNQGPPLTYRLTDGQVLAVDRAMHAVAELAQEQKGVG